MRRVTSRGARLAALCAAFFVLVDGAEAVLVTPVSVTLDQGSEFFRVGNLINDSGLSGAATEGNYTTITHAGASSGTAWVTNAAFPEYYSGLPAPIMTFTLDNTYNLTDVVSWGYHFGAPNNNEAKDITVEFSADGGATFPNSANISRTRSAQNADTQSLGHPFEANVVRFTITDNYAGEPGAAGGDRVGLGEVKFLAPESIDFQLTVDRSTGTMTLSNVSGQAIDFAKYSITSPGGAVDPNKWTSIAGNYDLAGDRSVDDDENWTVTSDPASRTDLSEEVSAGGIGGTMTAGQSVVLGTAWIQNPVEDAAVDAFLSDGSKAFAFTVFTGNNDSPFTVGDLNFDGAVDEGDWPIYRAGYGRDLSGLSPAEAYQRGDLNGDLVNNLVDFGLFKDAYEAALGPGALAAAVPEPSGLFLALVGGLLVLGIGRRRWVGLRRRLPLVLVGVLAAVVGASQGARAEVIKPISVTGTIAGDAGSAIDYLLNDNPGQAAASLQDALGAPVTLATGDTLGKALNTFHYRAGDAHQESWTRGTGLGNPVFTLDLGADTDVGSVLLWQYGNNGGPGTGNQGNSTRDFEIIFHTAAEGSAIDFGAEVVEFTGTMDSIPGDNTIDNFAQFFGFGSPVTAQYVGLRIANNYLGQPGITAGGDRYGLGEVRFATELIDRLVLEINTFSGGAAIKNDLGAPTEIDAYEILSSGNSLDPTGWNSLQDQDYEGGGAPQDPPVGDGWEELGTASVSSLAEAFLQGNSPIADQGSVSLGKPYDTGIDARDLKFTYRMADGRLVEGIVDYASTFTGDINGDGTLDDADLNLLLSDFGGTYGQDELATLLDGFGASAAPIQSAQAVPEPSSLWLSAIGLLASLLFVRRICSS